MTYKVKNTKNINVNIDYKSDMKTYNVGPKDKNSIATFIYPNGEQEKTRWLFPEYNKLIEISETISAKLK